MKFLTAFLTAALCSAATFHGTTFTGAQYRYDAAPIVLPIVVSGTNGITSNTVAVNVFIPSTPSSATTLVLKLHGMEWNGQGKVQVNAGATNTINNSLFTCLSSWQASFGCLFKGEHAPTVKIALAANLVVRGTNTIKFTYSGTDGNNSLYRVLSIQILDASNNPLIPSAEFKNDDPKTWTIPATFNNPTDIAAGKTAFQTATLTVPNAGGTGTPRSITAHCSDCHSKDGRDLATFNYENAAIFARAKFHALSDTQSNQIVAYIRSLSTTNGGTVRYCPNGRPWNPPYQPGPGLDAGPVECWTAGAGLDWVLESDQRLVDFVGPTGTAQDADPYRPINPRETPIPYQLIDWNHLIPIYYPPDAFPSAGFFSNAIWTDYTTLSNITAGSGSSYAANRFTLENWEGDRQNWFSPLYCHSSCAGGYWTVAQTQKVYSVTQWQFVKMWEIFQMKGLEGLASYAFPPPHVTEPRAWDSGAPFRSSPSIIQIAPPAPGIEDGSWMAFERISYMWYILQMVLNNGQHQTLCDHPVDWGYQQGFATGMATDVDSSNTYPMPGVPVGAFLLYTFRSGFPQNFSTANDPSEGCIGGFAPGGSDGTAFDSDPLTFVKTITGPHIWDGYTPTQRNNILKAAIQNFAKYVPSWGPNQYYAGNFAVSNPGIDPGAWYGSTPDEWTWWIPRYLTWTSDTATATKITSYANRLWPNATNNAHSGVHYDFNGLLTATCTGTTDLSCSTDH